MDTEVNADGQGTSAEETPDATSMSRDELNALLRGDHGESSQEDNATGGEGGEENSESSDEGAQDDSSNDDDQEGGSEAEDSPEIKALKEELRASNERIEQQSKLLDKFGTEVGILRKTSPEEEKARLDEIREAYLMDPIEGDRLLREYREEQKVAEKKSRDDELASIFEKNRKVVSSSIEDFESDSNIAEIAEIMEADGASKETIDAFKHNPYILDGSTLFALHKRNEALNEVKTLTEQLAERDTKIAELEKKPGEFVDRIANAVKTRPLSGKEGSSSSSNGSQSVPKKVANLSRAELKKLAHGG